MEKFWSLKVKLCALAIFLNMAACECGDPEQTRETQQTRTEMHKKSFKQSNENFKINKALNQGWTKSDLKKNKKEYNKSSDGASFLNEIVSIDADFILIKDFETARQRYIPTKDLFVKRSGSIISDDQIWVPREEIPIALRNGDIIKLHIWAYGIPGNRISGFVDRNEISAQEYYNNTDLLFNWEGNFDIYVPSLVVIKKRINDYKQANDIDKFNQLKQQMVDDIYQSNTNVYQ